MERVLYIVPGVGLSQEEQNRRKKILNTFTNGKFQVDVRAVRDGPASIESYYDEFLSVPPTVNLAREAEKEGYNAVIIGCFGDPGIEALREVLHIPVVGPGEASLYVAAMLGHRITIVSILKNIIEPLRTLTRKLGLIEKLASVRVIDKPVLSVGEDPEDTKRALIDAGRAAIQKDGADTLVLGCMSEAFLGFAEDMQKTLDVPVVNPVAVSVKLAELFLDARLSHSKRAYPVPPKKLILTSTKPSQ